MTLQQVRTVSFYDKQAGCVRGILTGQDHNSMAEDKAKELKRLNGIYEFSILHGVKLTPISQGSMFAIHPSNPVRRFPTEHSQWRKTNYSISVHRVEAQTGTGRQGYGTPQS